MTSFAPTDKKTNRMTSFAPTDKKTNRMTSFCADGKKDEALTVDVHSSSSVATVRTEDGITKVHDEKKTDFPPTKKRPVHKKTSSPMKKMTKKDEWAKKRKLRAW